MIVYAIERWADFASDAEPLFERHWEEIAIDRDKIKLSLDIPKYEAMDASGVLHILTMRDGGKLVGYFLAFLLPHVHYSGSGLMAFTDIYFVMPEYRNGSSGVQIFVEAEESLKAKGVTKAYLSCKVHADRTVIFEWLGWKKTDFSFTKVFI